MKRVFLLANNHTLDHHHVKNLNITENDIFFLF